MAPVSKIVYPEGVLTPSSSSKNHNLQMKSLVQKKSSFNTTTTTTTVATQINQDLIKNYHLINFVVKIEQIPRIWINELLNDYKINEDQNCSNTNKIPPYRTRHSKSPKIARQISRSPVLTRRPGKFYESDCDPSLQPIVLLSYETNEKLLLAHRNTLSDTNSFKRRCQRLLSTTVIQREYCTTYPANISRCIDCQLVNPSDSSIHSIGCRFQHCRILKYLNENRYEFEGFTSVDKATHDDTEVLVVPNSGEQPALNYTSANHTFIQIAKFFHLMCSYEETERKTYDEKKIIWKRYMAGWREVCDDCSTTLFNYHYMCQICGYMICIECFHEYSQMNIDKRKSKKTQRICMHENSFCLSEFIPWTILIELRNQCVEYLTKMKIDYSMKFNSSSRHDHLSKFIKTLKKNRIVDQHNVQQIWSTIDCNFDPNIEFYCHGRLPVFNEWISSVAKDFFQKVWSAGCPVLVRQVHRNLSKTLWQPRSFKLHMIDHRETPALWDCETLVPIPTNDIILTQFWDGFECLDVRLKDGQRSRILKLKDWPTKKDFASVFPSRLHDLMSNIPFGDYTRRSYTYNGIRYHGGAYNIVERLPSCLVKPDLGPKLYIAYSQLTSQSCRQAGTTNLHIDVSDAVNVLVYVGIGGYGEHGRDKDEEIRQVEAEVAKSKIDQAQLQRLKNGERPGALWHLFRSDDAPKIREYLGRTQRKIAGTDSIHDQTAYLEQDDLIQLKQQNNVESYAILQFQGDAIFIPSGAPHQVKNLHSCIKIAEDFVSPENLDRCLITTNEFRNLSKTHTNHADILQAKNILYYATRDALSSLINSQAQFD